MKSHIPYVYQRDSTTVACGKDRAESPRESAPNMGPSSTVLHRLEVQRVSGDGAGGNTVLTLPGWGQGPRFVGAQAVSSTANRICLKG